MKKPLAYVATAVLLGFAIMMLPKALETQQLTQTYMSEPEGTKNRIADIYGLASQPKNLLPPTLIFFSGLIVASGAYAILKRRTI